MTDTCGDRHKAGMTTFVCLQKFGHYGMHRGHMKGLNCEWRKEKPCATPSPRFYEPSRCGGCGWGMTQHKETA
jgi:hypothetical protein